MISSLQANKGFGSEFEEDDWNNMMLAPVGVPNAMRYPKGNHMFELGVTSVDGFGRREEKVLYVPHVNNLGELGLVVSGDAPVVVYKVDPGSAAARAGVDTGDELCSIGGHKCARSRHQEVVDLFTRVINTGQQPQELGGFKPATKRWSADGNVNAGFGGMSAGVDAGDIAISLPGQAGGGFDSAPQQQGPSDPYAPIREAAGRHQVEAARLMQEERFKEARVLLDRAIGLLQSIPQEPDSPTRSQHGSPSKPPARTNSARRPAGPGFRPFRSGGSKVLNRVLRSQPAPKGRRTPANKSAVTVIHTLDQIPDKVNGVECGFKPIKMYHVAVRRKTVAAAKATSVTVVQSSPGRPKPARQQAW
jgi:hypothetical protein